MSDLLVAAWDIAKREGGNAVFCSHVDQLPNSPSCCESCHTDEEMGYDNLWDEKGGIEYSLCCTKRNFIFGN